MVASRIAVPSHPMTSMSEEIFSLSILGLKSRPSYLKMPRLIVAGRSSPKPTFGAVALRSNPECPAAKLNSGSAQEVNNNGNDENGSKESAANNHVDLLS
jgi:hypothetical protein